MEETDRNDPAIRWLLDSRDPSIEYFTRTEVLGEPPSAYEVQRARSRILNGPKVRALLYGQQSDGGFKVHPYQKWRGAHWRLVSLVELGIPAGEPRALAAVEQVLRWLNSKAHLERIKRINELTRRCASQEGNALAVCSRLGMANDPRVKRLAESLREWQWPDGGWNCDKRRQAHHSSFYESLAPLWGLIEYRQATDDQGLNEAISRASEFFLKHRLFRSEKGGKTIDPRRFDGRGHGRGRRVTSEWLQLHYPLYWHYDILQALRVVGPLGKLGDPRVQEALDIIESKRLPDGRWKVEGCYWYRPRSRTSNVEVVDWGRQGPNRMITLNALRVLKAAGRLA